jgi:hypothetical protein
MDILELLIKQNRLEDVAAGFIDGLFHPDSIREIHLENLLLPFAVVAKKKSISLHTQEFNDALGPLIRTILISRLPANAQKERDVRIVSQVLFSALRGVASSVALANGPPLESLRIEAKRLFLGFMIEIPAIASPL